MGGIGTFDARRLPAQAQEDLRLQVVSALGAGMSQTEAAEMFAVSRRAVGRWARAYRETGPEALRGHRRGRPPGRHCLSRQTQAELLQALATGPQRPGELWCRRNVAELIECRAGVGLSLSAVGQYLVRWGLSAPVPVAGVSVQAPPDGAGVRVLRVAWTRPVPSYLGETLLPARDPSSADSLPGSAGGPLTHLELLTSRAARRDIHFLAAQTPWEPRDLADFGARLVATFGCRLHLFVHVWPGEHRSALIDWAEHSGPDVRVIPL